MKATQSVMFNSLFVILLGSLNQANGTDFPSVHPGYSPPEDWIGGDVSTNSGFPRKTAPNNRHYPGRRISPSTHPFTYAETVLKYALEGNLDESGAWEPDVNPYSSVGIMHPGCMQVAMAESLLMD